MGTATKIVSLLAALVLFAAAVVAGCGKEAPDKTSATEIKTPVIKVGHVGHDHQIALGIAALMGEKWKDKGTYLKELKKFEVYELYDGGRKVAELHLAKVKGGANMPAAMETGTIEIGLGGVAAVAKVVDKGNDFKIVSFLNTDGDMLVVKPDNPATDWASFVEWVKGREEKTKIGFKSIIAVAKLTIESAIECEGIRDRIELVNLQKAGVMPSSLDAGTVDAFVCNQPQPSIAKIKGIGRIIADLRSLPPAGEQERRPCCCVAVTGKLLAERRGVVRAFLKIIVLGNELINGDREKAAELAAEWTGVDLEVEKDSVPRIVYVVEMDDTTRKAMHLWNKKMSELGQFTGALKDKSGEEMLDAVADFTVLDEAIKELQ